MGNKILKNPIIRLFLSILIYTVLLFCIALGVESQNAGGNQYFLRIIAFGILLFPLICLIMLFIFTITNRIWTIRRWYIVVIILIILTYYYLLVLSTTSWRYL